MPEGKQAMTLEEFEQQWASANHLTIDMLREDGRYGAQCACGMDYCKGWIMAYSRNEVPDVFREAWEGRIA